MTEKLLMPAPLSATPAESVAPLFARNRLVREQVAQKKVAIFGAGSLGSHIAMQLARLGVDQFCLVDLPATVLLVEHLSRHVADNTMLGWPKVEAVKQCILRINPTADVQIATLDVRTATDGTLTALLPPDTLLLACTDSFTAQARINLFAWQHNLPALFVGCWGNAQIGEVLCVLPGRTGCLECYAGFRRESENLSWADERRYQDPNFDASRAPSQAGIVPDIVWLSSFAVQVALALLGCAAQQMILKNIEQNPLFLVNSSDNEAGLPCFAVSRGIVASGCAICQPERMEEFLTD